MAVRVLKEYLDKIQDDATTIDGQIHVGLLLTADGDHRGAQDAYRESIQVAERQSGRLPESQWVREQLGQAHAHLGMELWQQGRADEATIHLRAASEAFRRAISLAGPSDTFLFQHVAWFFSLCPDERLRDPKTALDFAGRVARLAPNHERDNPTTLAGLRPLMTLGLARYRRGDLAGARGPVEESIRIRRGGDAYEGFTLAMILARMGEREAGLLRYNEAELWMRRNRFGDFELHFLRNEAAQALGLTQPPK